MLYTRFFGPVAKEKPFAVQTLQLLSYSKNRVEIMT
jgi:hypothetical protein